MSDPTRYSYVRDPRDDDQLHGEIAALALPGFLGLCGGGIVVVAMFAGPLDAGQEAALAAAVAAHAPDASGPLKRLRAAAGAYFGDDTDRVQLVARAVILTALDEINILREWIAAFKGAVAASTSLADLKSRVAALPDTPDRTAAQAKNAVVSKISAGGAD